MRINIIDINVKIALIGEERKEAYGTVQELYTCHFKTFCIHRTTTCGYKMNFSCLMLNDVKGFDICFGTWYHTAAEAFWLVRFCQVKREHTCQ